MSDNAPDPTEWIDSYVQRELEANTARDVSVVRLSNSDGSFLMLRTRRLPNHWTLPGGGIEAEDRDPVAAAVREIREELGVDLDPVQLTASGEDASDLGPGIVYFFESAQPMSDTPEPFPDEVLDLVWMTLDQALAERLMPATRRYFERLAQKGERG